MSATATKYIYKAVVKDKGKEVPPISKAKLKSFSDAVKKYTKSN